MGDHARLALGPRRLAIRAGSRRTFGRGAQRLGRIKAAHHSPLRARRARLFTPVFEAIASSMARIARCSLFVGTAKNASRRRAEYRRDIISRRTASNPF